MKKPQEWDWSTIFVPSTDIPGAPSCPGREFLFTKEDISAFSDRLVDEFPNARFVVGPPSSEYWTPGREPVRRVCRSLIETGDSFPDLQFDPDWKPVYKWAPYYEGASEEDSKWHTVNPFSYPNGTFNIDPISFDCGESLSRLRPSRFYMRCQPGNKEHARLARRVMRILLDGATNKVEFIDYPSMRVKERVDKGWMFWIGPDAKRQCLEDSNRLLLFWAKDDGTAGGVRPLP